MTSRYYSFFTLIRDESKKFDAVKMMREIRDKLSEKFVNMSYEEQKKYIEERIRQKAEIKAS